MVSTFLPSIADQQQPNMTHKQQQCFISHPCRLSPGQYELDCENEVEAATLYMYTKHEKGYLMPVLTLSKSQIQ